MTVTCQATIVVVLVPCSNLLGDLFSSAPEVSDLVARLIPLLCIFMMGDAVESTNGGVLRGLGRQNQALWLNVLGFWIVGGTRRRDTYIHRQYGG